MRMLKIAVLASLLGVGVGCVSEEVEDEGIGEAAAAVEANQGASVGRFDKDAVLAITYYGSLSWSARAESNAWNWYDYPSGMGQNEFNWYESQGYPSGTCPSYSWGNECNSSRNTWFITPGWGANFQYYWGQPETSGWSTFGQHPYWCPTDTVGNGNGSDNTWHGWSTSNHCGGAN